ncbi:hypothetical protein BE08_44925 [Sorangium cellulosum]|uniref:Uncharacterized protein n=1 Tax=Sorangium cellulosum TaxID=56 RepID=A0A150PB67_SORCE|nr:hypothetical protein BE08_44925 [Sorangium cellulosum]
MLQIGAGSTGLGSVGLCSAGVDWTGVVSTGAGSSGAPARPRRFGRSLRRALRNEAASVRDLLAEARLRRPRTLGAVRGGASDLPELTFRR